MCDEQRLRPACAYAQTDQSLCQSLKNSITVKLLIKHYLDFLSLNGGCIVSSEFALVKMPHFWKSFSPESFEKGCCQLQAKVCA